MRNLANRTVQGYRAVLRSLARGAERIGLLRLEELDEDAIRSWVGTWTCRTVGLQPKRTDLAMPAGLRSDGEHCLPTHRYRLWSWCSKRAGHAATRDAWVQGRNLAAEYRDLSSHRAFDYPYVTSVLESIAVDYEGIAR